MGAAEGKKKKDKGENTDGDGEFGCVLDGCACLHGCIRRDTL